ncbi:MAG TPA: DUF262 domain-containing protein [Sphingomicrobium sp.]|nr:DUF262 domain-containing protein [Sphingomicrobium sp.]
MGALTRDAVPTRTCDQWSTDCADKIPLGKLLPPVLIWCRTSIVLAKNIVDPGGTGLANLEVSEINVPGLIKKLKTSEWLSPLFQRDFVWSTAAVVSLVNSIIDARPVGMITLWEQEEGGALPLEPISIPDWDEAQQRTGDRFFANPKIRPGKFYAILDGRQRSTALAIAFGGLKATSGVYRNAGRYFLDVCAQDDAERVKFITERETIKKRLNILKVAVSNGLFPLEVENPDDIFDQWMSYLQHIRDPSFYEDGKLPDDTELSRRNSVLKRAFDGIIKTKIATYTVPGTYDLAEICDIFETLNTTGTKVSTVDLIHSNIYSDTATDKRGPILIRDQIDELGEMDGAVGWADSANRPELIAQFAAAMHVALENKPQARALGGKKDLRIASVKSQDLLALPAEHWRNIFDQKSEFAGLLGGFQQAVAGGLFAMEQCPYPASAAIYLGLRWELFAEAHLVNWRIDQLDALFRAFFWRNALSRRYDQGFLTQVGTDLIRLKAYLNEAAEDANFDHWRAKANSWLDSYVGPAVDRDAVLEALTDGKEAGAVKKSTLLLLYARASVDVIDQSVSITHGSGNLQLHHIYPKDWCANNSSGELSKFLDKDKAGRDWINAASNLMPMARSTNLLWRKKSPAHFIHEQQLSYDVRPDLWSLYFVSRPAFEALAAGPDGLPEFWHLRSQGMADELVHRMMV